MIKLNLLEQSPVKVWAALTTCIATITMSILKPILPHGGRKVPWLIIITAGWIAAGLTIPMGVLAILSSIMQALGLLDGPVRFDSNGLIVLFVYEVWLLYGFSTGAAAWRYSQQTRSECMHAQE